MKKYYINYADKNFQKQQNFALKMAKQNGDFDEIIAYHPKDIDKEFYDKNKNILSQPRGGGYWLWKPYFIVKTLEKMEYGDYLFYSDSGAFFLKSVNILIDELEKANQNIMGFELPLIEKQWTKKELFLDMECIDEQYFESNQMMAGFHLIKKTKFSIEFYNKYLYYACNELNITDIYDNSIKQDKTFIDHRHDQSIFSLLYKKYNLKPFKDATQIGKYPRGYSASWEDDFELNKLYTLSNGRLFRIKEYKEKYENILFINRKGDPITSLVKFKIKEVLYKVGLFKGLVR